MNQASFEAMHAAEVLLLFPDPVGIDIPALQTCHFQASLEQKWMCWTSFAQRTVHMRFSCSQQSILSNGLWEFGTARGHLCADVLQTAYVGFSTLTSRQKTKQAEETNISYK